MRGRRAPQPLAFAGVFEHAQNLAHVIIGAVGNQEMLFVHSIHATGCDTARDHRHAHGHRLENLVLRAARDVERRDHQRRTAHVGAHVEHRTGDRHAGQFAEPAHRRRRIGADDHQLDIGATLAQFRQGTGAEFEHALLIRVVIHAPDEADGVRVVGAVDRGEVMAVHAVGEPLGRHIDAVTVQRLPFRARGGGAKIEFARQLLLFAQQLFALKPVAGRKRKTLVLRVLQPLV